MKNFTFEVFGKVKVFPGEAAWYYLTIPESLAGDIKDSYMWPRRGFGAIPVKLNLGKTTWTTSVFPEKSGTLMTPLKKEVRIKEGIKEGADVKVTLVVLNNL